MKVIYEPKGRALEYAELAVNLYNGCSHGCQYCYAPAVMHKTKEDFFWNPQPRKILNLLEKDVTEMVVNCDEREVLMCFSCDPYQQIDEIHKLTRSAINMFIDNDIHFSILTKGGYRSERDFDLIQWASDLCRYGATLVFATDDYCHMHEPFAEPNSGRIAALKKAHELSIFTWVSIEPSWSYWHTEQIILQTHGFVDEYKIGKLNYHTHSKEVDWKDYKNKVVDLCESLGVNYILKNDLAVL
jgi:DNA repair photolyase